jgi:hypothetical protein
MRDLLAEIEDARLTSEEAQGILDRFLDSPNACDVAVALGFSQPEWTAYGHGAGLAELARWRAKGWPRACRICSREIRVEDFGWTVRESGSGSELLHISCLADQREGRVR